MAYFLASRLELPPSAESLIEGVEDTLWSDSNHGLFTMRIETEYWARELKLEAWMGSNFSNDDLVKENSFVDDGLQRHRFPGRSANPHSLDHGGRGQLRIPYRDRDRIYRGTLQWRSPVGCSIPVQRGLCGWLRKFILPLGHNGLVVTATANLGGWSPWLCWRCNGFFSISRKPEV